MANSAAQENAQIKRRFYLKYRYEITMVVTILVLAAGVFLFFKSFFDLKPNSLTTEILAALLGSILTVMITMLLIRQQGTVEQALEESAASKTKVFEKKLELFNEFIGVYTEAAIDGKLCKKELARLEKLALTISLLTKETKPKDRDASDMGDLGEKLCRFVLQLELFGLAQKLDTTEQLERYKTHFGESDALELYSLADILGLMKKRLGVAQLDTGESDKAGDDKAYVWARKLLDYRDYQLEDEMKPC